jgi:hypothetical protein
MRRSSHITVYVTDEPETIPYNARVNARRSR